MPTDRLQFTELLRTHDPEEASAEAVRLMLAVVAEWPPGASLDITFGTQRGYRLVSAEHRGTATQGWEEDVRWALRAVAVPQVVSQRSDLSWTHPAPTHLVRIRPRRDARPFLSPLQGEEQPATHGGLLAAVPWPQPLRGDLHELAELLAGHPDVALRWRLGSPTHLEREMVEDSLRSTWTGRPDGFAEYLGSPVRLVAMIGSLGDPVPHRLRAMARRWATNLDVLDVDLCDVESHWSGTESVLDSAMPERAALGLLRLPAAGPGPFPGMATQNRAASVRALDPVPPPPTSAIRLGAATTAAGEIVDAVVDVRDLLRHVAIEGQSGAGKSTLIAAIVRELTIRGVGCTFFDPHGATIDLIESELPEQCDSTRVVRFADVNHPVPLNLLAGTPSEVERAIDLFTDLVQRMYDPRHEGVVGPRWRRWFSLIALATYYSLGRRASLVAVAELAGDVRRVQQLAEAVRPSHPELAKSLIDEIVNDRSNEAAATLAWCMSKLHPLIATGQMRAILGTGHDALDVVEMVDNSQSLLVDLGSVVLGESVARLLCALLLEKFRVAMGARLRRDTVHVLIIDEAHLVQFGALDTLLSEARKFGIGVIVASQYRGQFRTAVAESLDANAGSVVTFRTGLPYAHQSALRLGGWQVAEIVRLPSLTAAVSVSRDGAMTDAFTLHVDHHERMEREGARGETAAKRAGRLRERSLLELWTPYRDAPVVTAAEIDDTLAALAQRPRRGQPERSFLDDWHAQRSVLRPSDAEAGEDIQPPR